MTDKHRRFLLTLAHISAILMLALIGGCSCPEPPPEPGENIIKIVIGKVNGTVAHHSQPYVIQTVDGRRMPAPAVGTVFTATVDSAGTFTVQAPVAPEPVDVYEPNGATLAFSVPQDKQVVAPFESAPYPATDITQIDLRDIITVVEDLDISRIPPEPKPHPEKIELKIWHAWEDAETEWLKVTGERFREQYPQVGVEIEQVAPLELQDKYLASLEAGAPPDLILGSNDAAIEWGAQGLVQPVNDVEEQGLLSEIYPSALDTLRYEGQLWGIPFQSKTVALYYNRELLSEPPSDTDELLAMVEEGYTLALPAHTHYTYGFLKGYGGQLLEEGKAAVESGGTESYLGFIRRLAQSNYLLYGSSNEIRQAFQEYEAAMIVDGVWMLPHYRQFLGEALDVALLPQVVETGRLPTPILATDACLVPVEASEAEREAAIEFALFLTGEESQAELIQKADALPVNPWVSIEDPLLSKFAQQAQFTTPGILHPKHDTVLQVAQEMLERVIFEEWSPEEAAKNAAEELNQAGIDRE